MVLMLTYWKMSNQKRQWGYPMKRVRINRMAEIEERGLIFKRPASCNRITLDRSDGVKKKRELWRE